MNGFRRLTIFLWLNIPIPTPAPFRGDPVDCIGGPVDWLLLTNYTSRWTLLTSLFSILKFARQKAP